MMRKSRLWHLILVSIWSGSNVAAWSGSTRTGGTIRWKQQQPLTPLLGNGVCRQHSLGFGPAAAKTRSVELHVQATMDDGVGAASPQQERSVLLAERTQPEAVAIPAVMDLRKALLPDDHEKLKQRIINGIFLAVSFGYVVYTIVTIDHGMTRGWTHEEMLLRIPLDNWNNYETSLAEKPVFTKTLINVIIYLLGDWLSQTVFQKKNVLDFDITRTLRNGFIGLCFGPLVHQYYEWSDYILPVEGGFWNRAEKILMDQTLYLVVKCSIYISAIGLLKGDSWEDVKQNVQERIGGIVVTAWKFWPLVHCITYGLIPARHRILWVNSVDLIWNAILATKAQRQEPEPVQLIIESSSATANHVDEGLMEITLVESSSAAANHVDEGLMEITLVETETPTTLMHEHVILTDEATLLTTLAETQAKSGKSLNGQEENLLQEQEVNLSSSSLSLLSRNSTTATAVSTK